MNVTLNPDGAITIDGDADRASTKVTDDIMRQVTAVLGGQTWAAVKLSGIWVVGTTLNGAWTPRYGHLDGQQTRRFTKALALATGRAVTTT